MYLLPIAWLYVTMMMAVAEATNSNGTVLGAIVTFVLYGLLPVLLVVYLMRTPSRRKAIRAREAESPISVEDGASLRSGPSREVSVNPDTGSHAAAAAQGDAVTPVREEK